VRRIRALCGSISTVVCCCNLAVPRSPPTRGCRPTASWMTTLRLADTGAETLADARAGNNGRHRLAGLLRQSVFGGRPATRCERCRKAVPRSRDALRRRRPGDHRVFGVSQPDGPVRDEMAEPARESCRSRRSAGQWIDKYIVVTRQGPFCSTWIRARVRHTATRKAAPTMAISVAPATTRCSCLTSSVTKGAVP